MGSFREELALTAKALVEFRGQLQEGSKAQEEGSRAVRRAAGSGDGFSLAGLVGSRAAGLAGSALAVASTVAPYAEAALQNYNATGSLESAAGGALRTGLEAIRGAGPIGSLLAEVTGISDALDVRSRASDRVRQTTEQLARYDIPISDVERQRLIDITVQQERRVQDERQRVNAELDKFGNLGAASGDSLLGSILGVLQSIDTKIGSASGGAVR